MTDAVRTRPLLEGAQRDADRYWRTGPGSAAALPHLDRAVTALDEAYGYLEPGDNLRGQVAAQLGWLLGTRYTAHGGAERDRETGIFLLEEALGFANLPPMLGQMRLVLGQLYLGRVTARLGSADMMALLRSGGTPDGAADVDRAADCFRQVLAGPPVSADLTRIARTLLDLAEAMGTVLGGFRPGAGGFDLSRLMSALATMQRIGQPGSAPPSGAGPIDLPWIFDAERIANLDPRDRPVAVIHDTGPDGTAGPDGAAGPDGVAGPDGGGPSSAAPPDLVTDAAALRAAAREALARICDGPTDDVARLAALLAAGAAQPEITAVEDLVAAATATVHSGPTDGTDHLVLATALYLRHRAGDGDGWGGDGWGGDGWGDGDADSDTGSGDDVAAAAESLRSAAENVPTDRPGVVPILLRLAQLLQAGGVLDRLAARYAEVAAALREVGAGGLVQPHADGLLLLDAATGRVDLVPADSPLPHRVLVVGDDTVPSTGPVVSYVSSPAQIVTLAQRTRPTLTADPVFLANPRGDRESASVLAMLVRRTFYPHSTGLGRTIEQVDGAGTPADLLSHLDASMLHLDCGIDAHGALELAGPAGPAPAELIAATTTGRSAGGLVILARSRDSDATLADALLAVGFTGVVDWRWQVPEHVAGLMLFLLHAKLVDDRLAPAEAVHEVQAWMRGGGREPTPDLPPGYASVRDTTDLADRTYWAALMHRGT